MVTSLEPRDIGAPCPGSLRTIHELTTCDVQEKIVDQVGVEG
jgi:hypothetical protein